MTQRKQLTGADELRRTVALLNNCREDFLDRFTAPQLLTLGRAYRACGWDISPDRWEEDQVLDALSGYLPTWDDEEGAVYLPVEQRSCLAAIFSPTTLVKQ